MKIFVRLLITIIAFSFILITISAVTGISLVVPISDTDKRLGLNSTLPPDSAISVFSKFNFSSGNWKAYIVVEPSDFQSLHPLLHKRSCVKTDDNALLREMQKTWLFKVSKDADLTTVTGSIYLFKENELVFSSGIVLDENFTALQNRQYGEMLPVNKNAMVNSAKRFKPVCWPVIFL